MLAGSPTCVVASSMTRMACSSEAPGARLNESVTAGNWPWRVMASGAVVSRVSIIVLSGAGGADVVPRT